MRRYIYIYIYLCHFTLKIKHSKIKCCRLSQHQTIRFLENRTPKASHNGI